MAILDVTVKIDLIKDVYKRQHYGIQWKKAPKFPGYPVSDILPSAVFRRLTHCARFR